MSPVDRDQNTPMHSAVREIGATGNYANWQQVVKFLLEVGNFHAVHLFEDMDFRAEIDALCVSAHRA